MSQISSEEILTYEKKLEIMKEYEKVTGSYNKKSKFKYSLKENITKRNKILELQKLFEEGKIKEDELTEEERRDLENLYDEQIKELDRTILVKKKVLNKKINIVNTYYKKLIDLKTNKK